MTEVQKFLDNHKVSKMAEEKRLRLINAGMEEFTKGYNQASTDVIVREAGISKGLLFHYFGTKKDFFLFLHTYAMKVVVQGVFDYMNLNDGDVIERFWQLILMKMELMKVHKNVFDFLKAAYIDDREHIPPESRKEYEAYMKDSYEKLYAGIDYSKFKDDVKPEDALKIISWTIQGIGQEEERKYKGEKDYEKFFDEDMKAVRGYFDLLKTTLYK